MVSENQASQHISKSDHDLIIPEWMEPKGIVVLVIRIGKFKVRSFDNKFCILKDCYKICDMLNQLDN